MTMAQARQILHRLGAAEISLDEAALALVPAYRQAAEQRAQRDPAAEDDDGWPTAWTMIAVARMSGTITADQAADLVDAVAGWNQALT